MPNRTKFILLISGMARCSSSVRRSRPDSVGGDGAEAELVRLRAQHSRLVLELAAARGEAATLRGRLAGRRSERQADRRSESGRRPLAAVDELAPAGKSSEAAEKLPATNGGQDDGAGMRG
jgi:hypothetical protein